MRGFKRFHRNLGIDSQRASTSPVIFAFVAGMLVAVAKTVAAVLTGSASMLAEAVHSWVDTATECFLIAAYFTARRPADARHPLGYGRESYVWSLFASLGMFIVGAEVGIWRGITQLGASEATAEYGFGYIVIAVSFVLEGASFGQALRFVRSRAGERDQGIVEHVFRTSDSQLRAVFTEDFLALVTLAIAASGMALHQVTGKVVYDAAGSILIGVLMGAAGLMLINLNRRFLAGMPLTTEQRTVVLGLLKKATGIDRVTFLFTEFIGPDRILLAARVSIAGDHTQAQLAHILRKLEQEIMTNKHVGQVILTLATPEDDAL
jgi:cation diffusion facilitator family transporter